MTIAPTDWTSALAHAVRRAAADDYGAIWRDVATGGAQAWCVNAGEAYLITRVEDAAGRLELVVMVAAGEGLAAIASAIYAAAEAARVDRIRWHTARPGIARMVGRNYIVREIERVYAVEVNRGQ